jgi:signal transduction histidine kinase
MIPASIRWRLPLSYAAIALVTTISLGFVLLFTLRSYYANQEKSYLQENAQAIRSEVATVFWQQLPKAALQSQIAGFAFLSQTRIRLLDIEENVIVDSSLGLEEVSTTTFSVEMQVDEVLQSFSQTLTEGSPQVNYRSVIIIEDDTAPTKISTARQVNVDFDVLPPSHELITYLPVFGTFYGFSLGYHTAVEDQRSEQVVRLPIYHELSSDLLGYIELSEGPAYGRVVVNNVAWSWAAASLVAVILSAGIGWIVSQQLSAPLIALTEVTLQMIAGDLTSRAEVNRKDEVGILGRSFNLMANQVEETVSALRRFVSDAAHELHTPLTVLHSDLELIRNNIDDHDQLKRVVRAYDQVTRLETLTSGLLDLSRIESGTIETKFQPVDVNAFVKTNCEQFASRAEQKGLCFELNISTEPLIIKADEDQLYQALRNLLENAIKFTPEGGRIMVSVGKDQDQVVVTVADTGIGIPEEDIPYIFNRFHRGRNARSFSGNGLGLAIVKAVADGLGGTISAQNTSPGARFSLHLPME